MFSRTFSSALRSTVRAKPQRVAFSTEARPMTRFIKYPMDKTKMDEVRTWMDEPTQAKALQGIRAEPGVQSVEVSFCPGEGWLASRMIFTDLPHMVSYLEGNHLEVVKDLVTGSEFYDDSRSPEEFKGFFLWEQ